MSNREPPKAPFSFFPSILLILFVILRVIIHLNRTNLIIQYGIKAYRTYNTISMILLILSLILCCFFSFWQLNYHLKKKKSRTTVSSESDALLSVSKDLDSAKLQKILSMYMESTTWQNFQSQLSRCKKQLESMDEQQAKLARLLDNNGANNLSDTQNVLDQVEQYMCKSIRKVINYMQVADPETDTSVLQTKLDGCYNDCQKQLEQVKEFLFVMAEFLNKQGGEDNTPETLEIYKNTILKSIHDEI